MKKELTKREGNVSLFGYLQRLKRIPKYGKLKRNVY